MVISRSNFDRQKKIENSRNSSYDNFINHSFCDEGETDFFGSGLVRFESGLGEGLEESVYFCACHLGWEGVITV